MRPGLDLRVPADRALAGFPPLRRTPKRAGANGAGNYRYGTSPAERLANRCIHEPNSGCLLWTGPVDEWGAGHFSVEGKLTLVHRFAWEIASGPIPDGVEVLHRCRVICCCEPRHLYLGDDQTQVDAKMAAGAFVPSPGERNGNVRLSVGQVLQIIVDPRPSREIAPDFGVHPSTVNRIKRGDNWSHIDRPAAVIATRWPRRQPRKKAA